jgi:5-methylthioadenosine/S-adenosylhomocysteine deaminase
MPGFINTHTHAAMAYFRGLADDLPLESWLSGHIWPAEAKHVNPRFVRQASELACLEMAMAGTTCFADMYFFEDEVAGAAADFGLRAVIGEGILDFPTPNAKTPDDGLRVTGELLAKYQGNELISVAVAPHSIYTVNGENLKKCAELAQASNAILHIHLSETQKEVEDALRDFKKTPVEYLEDAGVLSGNVLAAHAVWLDRTEVRLMAERKAKVSHNPASNLKLASGIAPISAMIAAGVTVGIGTDGAASNNSLDLISDMKLAGLLHKGIALDPTCLKAREILKMATVNGADCLGLAGKTGCLEPGKRADLIAIDLNAPNLQPLNNIYSHLAYALHPGDVTEVMVNGKFIMQNREMKTMDAERIIKEAKLFIAK